MKKMDKDKIRKEIEWAKRRNEETIKQISNAARRGAIATGHSIVTVRSDGSRVLTEI